MSRHLVNVPEYAESGRRRLTAGEWLREFAIVGARDRSQLLRLAPPIRLTGCYSDHEPAFRWTFQSAYALFQAFDELGRRGGLVTALGTRGWRLGPHGLFVLNSAIRTPAFKQGGLSIVRSFVHRNQPGGHISVTRHTLPDLLAFLEIRTISTLAALKAPQTPRPLIIMSNIALAIT